MILGQLRASQTVLKFFFFLNNKLGAVGVTISFESLINNKLVLALPLKCITNMEIGFLTFNIQNRNWRSWGSENGYHEKGLIISAYSYADLNKNLLILGSVVTLKWSHLNQMYKAKMCRYKPVTVKHDNEICSQDYTFLK